MCKNVISRPASCNVTIEQDNHLEKSKTSRSTRGMEDPHFLTLAYRGSSQCCPSSSASTSSISSALASPVSELTDFDLFSRNGGSSRATPDTSVDGDNDGPLPVSSIILGGGVFGAQYSPQEYLSSGLPAQVIELAFENRINAIDTSPFYGVSEEVIGAALASPRIASKFPRHTYHLITKCGRYGANKRSFDYSPERIRASVQESLRRLNTTYLDAVYLHDVEFVAEEVGSSTAAGYPVNALEEGNLAEYGLDDAEKIHGEGDRAILSAFETLLQLKDEGLIRKAGMAAYPLPTLLRLTRLIKHHLGPVDIVQSYSHYNLQNACLAAYVPLFRSAGVQQIFNASPLNMGLLSAQGAQDWHLAPSELKQACRDSNAYLVNERNTTLQSVALGFGLNSTRELGCNTVVGCTMPEHVAELTQRWRLLFADKSEGGVQGQQRDDALLIQAQNEEKVRQILGETGYLNWSWQSPPAFEEAERS